MFRLHTLGTYWGAERTPPAPSQEFFSPVSLVFNGSRAEASSDSDDSLHFVDIFDHDTSRMTSIEQIQGKQSNENYISENESIEYDPVTTSVYGVGKYREGSNPTVDPLDIRVTRVDVPTRTIVWSAQPFVLSPHTIPAVSTSDRTLLLMGVTENIVWLYIEENDVTFTQLTSTVIGLSKADGSLVYVYHEPDRNAPSPTGNMSSRGYASDMQAINDTSFVIGYYSTTPTPDTRGLNIVTMTGANTWTAQDVLFPLSNDAFNFGLYSLGAVSDRRGNYYLTYEAYETAVIPLVYRLNTTTLQFELVVSFDNTIPGEVRVKTISFDLVNSHVYVTLEYYDPSAGFARVSECIRYSAAGSVFTELNRFSLYSEPGSGYPYADGMFYCNNYVVGLSSFQGIAIWAPDSSGNAAPLFATDQRIDAFPGYGIPYQMYTPLAFVSDFYDYPGNNLCFFLLGNVSAPAPYVPPSPPPIEKFVYEGMGTVLNVVDRLTWYGFEYLGNTTIRMELPIDVKGYLFDETGFLVANTNGRQQFLHLQLKRGVNLPGVYYLAVVDVRDEYARDSLFGPDEVNATSKGFVVDTYTLPPIAPSSITLDIFPNVTDK